MSAIPLSQAANGSWQQSFLALLPAITARARMRFRRLRCDQGEEAVQEAIAAACTGYEDLATAGRLCLTSVATLADFAARHVREGRHVGGRQDAARDALSPTAQRRHRFQLQRLDCLAPPGRRNECFDGEDWRGMLIAERRQSIPDVAAFRIDCAVWLKSLGRRDRRIIRCLIAGEPSGKVAERLGLSRSRISQLRRRYEHLWRAFQGEGAAAAA